MEKRNNYKTLFAWLAVLLVLCSLLLTSNGAGVTAFAESTGYSYVLDDLCKDETFNTEDYPASRSDYSLQVIQIAESTEKELFVYVYQPSAPFFEFTVTSINMSIQQDGNNRKLYELELLSRDGVFGKYLVKGFEVNQDEVRYYDIAAIYRKVVAEIDEDLITSTGGNTDSEIAFEVGWLWTVSTEDGKLNYSRAQIDTIRVTEKYVSYIEYSRGFYLYKTGRCRSHYVAFSTDKDMDILEEVQIVWDAVLKSSYTEALLFGATIHYKDKVTPLEATWTNKDYMNNAPTGLFSRLVEQKRIQTVSEFIASENLTKNEKENLQGKQWVLRFFESAVDEYTQGTATYKSYYVVSDETILRLQFKKNGKSYNLGVVDNKTTPDPDAPPGNDPLDVIKLDFWGWLARVLGVPKWAAKLIFALFILLFGAPILMLILSIFFPVLRTVLADVFKGVWKGIKYFFKGLWWLITLPFRGIAKLHQTKEERRRGSDDSENK